jgi:hypothetical protein
MGFCCPDLPSRTTHGFRLFPESLVTDPYRFGFFTEITACSLHFAQFGGIINMTAEITSSLIFGRFPCWCYRTGRGFFVFRSKPE